MGEPVIWHPAVDRVTPEALIVEQDRAVVPLATWLVDAATAATAQDRVLQILTPATSRITYPLELLLRTTPVEWIARERPEQFRDGIHGFTMRWNGNRFAPDLDATPPEPHDSPPGSGDLELQLSTVYKATEMLEVGGATDAAFRALTGAGPTGWGTAEPATQPWSGREITVHCRERVPSPTQLVVVGNGAVGTLTIERVDTGVLERIQLSGPPAGTVGQEAIETLAADLAGTARSLIVAAHPGRLHGLRASTPSLPALPYGILIGHSVVAGHGVEHARQTPGSVRILGQAPRQAAWCRLDSGPLRPYEALHAVLRHFGLQDPPE